MILPTFTIHGQPPSKSNCYRIIRIGGCSRLGKTKALTEYERAFFIQCPLRGRDITQWFTLRVDVYFKTNAPDLDNAFKVIFDCLQGCKAIRNDRYCSEIHARKLIDKENPRIEVTIEIPEQ